MKPPTPKKMDQNKDGFPCDLCEYVAPRRAHLIRHKRGKHKGETAIFDPIKNQVWLFK